jgi:tripartite-type tricarboxylate transporter receptor subunit TctC
MKRRSLLMNMAFLPLISESAELPRSYPKFKPRQTVRLIVPNAPGGAMDIIARALGIQLSALWEPYSVIPDYKPGAGTLLGMEFLARSGVDGHVFGVVATPLVIQPAIKILQFNPQRDLTPLVRIGTSDLLLSCSPSLHMGTFNQMLEQVRANPGKYTCATAGIGSAMHMALELLQQRAGLTLRHIPFNGAGPAFVEVTTGRVDFLLEPVFSCLPHIAQNRLHPLATTGWKRHQLLNDVPCMHELFPNLTVQSFFGLAGPAGMSSAVVQTLQDDLLGVMNTSIWKERLESLGVEYAPMTAAVFAQYLKEQLIFWTKLAQQRGLKDAE